MRVPTALNPAVGGKVRSEGIDRLISSLAGDQHGVVGRRQLLDRGVGRHAIDHRISRGRLHLLHRGLYAVGHRAVSRDGMWLAAVFAAGPDAVLSHRDAAALWGIRPSNRAGVDVTVPRHGRSRRGIRIHAAPLPEDEITEEQGIPVTTPARTIFDLAPILSRRDTERALEQSEIRQLWDHTPLSALIDRPPRRNGAPVVRAILKSRATEAGITRSELEELFLAFITRAALPRPERNVHIEAAGRLVEVDTLWRGARLAAELDGRAAHGSWEAWERDRARDLALAAAGWEVVRVTWRRLHDRPAELAAELRSLLDRRDNLRRT